MSTFFGILGAIGLFSGALYSILDNLVWYFGVDEYGE